MSMLRAVCRGGTRVVHWSLYVGRVTTIHWLLVVPVALMAVAVVTLMALFAAAVPSAVVVALTTRVPSTTPTIPSGGHLQDNHGDDKAGEKRVHSLRHFGQM